MAIKLRAHDTREYSAEFLERYIHKWYFRGIRTDCLTNLILLFYVVSKNENMGGMADKLDMRRHLLGKKYLDGWGDDRMDNLEVMADEEIMELLHCSKRTAKDYRKALEVLIRPVMP